MPPITSFLLANMVPIYFVYGLAFFSMGLAVMLESRRTSELPIARCMGLLAGFGLFHGIHEWVDMAQLLAGAQNPWMYSAGFELGRDALLAFSFLLLFGYGARLVMPSRYSSWRVAQLLVVVSVIWLLAWLGLGWILSPSEKDWLVLGDILGRYTIAVPGAVLTSLGLIRQRQLLQAKGMPAFGRDLVIAAFAFGLYGMFGQIFVRPGIVFPSTVVNSALFLSLFGIPVQLFRSIMAITIALTLIHALRAFDIESSEQLKAANDARLRAQQEALDEQRKRQEEIAQLNRELQGAARELTVLYDLSRILASTLELDTLLKEAVSRIVQTLDQVSAASIWLYDDATGELTLMACDGCGQLAEGVRLAAEEPGGAARRLIRSAVSAGSVMGFYPDGSIGPVAEDRSDEGGEGALGSDRRPRMVGVPLIRKERARGGLVLEVAADQAGFSADDLPLASALAAPLSIAVENAILYGELKSHDAARGELLHRIVSAQEAERQRVARELHDETGQALIALALGLKGTAETIKVNPTQAALQLEELRMETSEALDALRRMVVDLRPSQLDDLGLAAALRWYVEDFGERFPLRAAIVLHGQPRRLPPDVESVLFRIAQESLINVGKHAGAKNVSVALTFLDALVKLEVADDGIGFDPDAALKPRSRRKAWGLLGMQERADLVGGRCQVISAPKEGTRVIVDVPVGPGGHGGRRDGEVAAVQSDASGMPRSKANGTPDQAG
jgi:signal transduction histidine kinase